MLFNTYSFIIFFTLILGIYYTISSWKWQKILLLVASYIFYSAWNPPFVILLLTSTFADWILSKKINVTDNYRIKKILLSFSLIINLGLLAFFKYGNFLLDNLTYILHIIGLDIQFAHANIILPVGISFYTFQTLSYTIDIYKKKTKPWHSFTDYALYVTFFPQLVAGPIVRSTDFLPQCSRKNATKININSMGWGLTLILIGLFSKSVIADTFMAPIVEKVFDSPAPLLIGTLQAWAGTMAFAIQIFCDFAGYSLCAIGSAHCLGFSLPQNFNSPYASIGFSDFWRRWHITLSSWLRDYLYIPMGGNKKGKRRTQINLVLTMVLGGLWHGASWLFIIWGALHGIFLLIEKTFKEWLGDIKLFKFTIMKLLLANVTFLAVCIAWVFLEQHQLNRHSTFLKKCFHFQFIRGYCPFMNFL